MTPKKNVALGQRIDDSLKPEFINAAMRVLAESNREAIRYCARHKPEERQDLFGHLERGLIESGMRQLQGAVPGVRAVSHKNSKKTANYVEVQIGEFSITFSAVESPGRLPRSAEFRNERSMAGQMGLFGDPLDNSEKRVYAILTHCRNKDNQVVDASLVIPDETGKKALGVRALQDHLSLAIAELAGLAPTEEVKEVELGLQTDVAISREA